MDVAALTRAWEDREEALSQEYYRQYAGEPYDEARMEQLALETEQLARAALATHARADLPPILWQGLVAASAARKLTALQNETYRLRNESVRVDVDGESVNLNNVRQFNHRHVRDAPRRKRAFDALMEQAARLTPTLEARFRLSADVWAPHDMTPLDAYLAEERITRRDLTRVVDEAARHAKPAFLRAADEYAREILGKPMEYFDDMYVFRHAIYAPVDEAFRAINFESRFAELGRALGFDASAIGIDGETRNGKYSSPVCFGVRIPGDVRVLYQRTSPFGDYESFYHEMGHAVHFASVDAARPFENRRLIPNGVAEIFSTLFEELAMDPIYLKEDLGLASDTVDEAMRRRRFMDLFFLVFYGANAMHKIRFWTEKHHADFARADEAYEQLTERYMGVRVPGRYWQTHHILSMSDVYAPSYLLAHIRKSELVRALQQRHGRRWWRDPDAGAFLRREAMAPGGAIDLDAFSKLDADAYVRPILEGRA